MKRWSVPLTVFALVLMMHPQVKAVDITITEDGRIEFYQSQVLGEESDSPNTRQTPTQKPDTTRATSPNRPQELRMKANDQKVEIRLQNATSNPSATPQLRSIETMESDRVRLQMSAEGTSGSARTQNNAELQALRNEYKEKLQAERQARKQEMLEIRNQFKEKKQQLLLESRNVRAELKNGAEFSIDPNTNEISVTTPSGETHVLNHLPDQAIERMKAAGIITESSELEIDSTDADNLQYKLQVNKPKRFLGLIKREIPVEVKLDDETGEVSETQIESDSLMQRLLDRLSY